MRSEGPNGLLERLHPLLATRFERGDAAGVAELVLEHARLAEQIRRAWSLDGAQMRCVERGFPARERREIAAWACDRVRLILWCPGRDPSEREGTVCAQLGRRARELRSQAERQSPGHHDGDDRPGDLARCLEGEILREHAVHQILWRLEGGGEGVVAQRVRQRIGEEGRDREERSRALALGEIASVLFSSGDRRGGREVFAWALQAAGGVGASSRPGVFRSLAEQQAGGAPGLAAEALERAVKAAEPLEGTARVLEFREIGEVLARMGEPRAARRCFETAVEAAHGTEMGMEALLHPHYEPLHVYEFATEAAQAHWFDGLPDALRDPVLHQAAVAQAGRGQLREALDAMGRIRDRSWERLTWIGIGLAYWKPQGGHRRFMELAPGVAAKIAHPARRAQALTRIAGARVLLRGEDPAVAFGPALRALAVIAGWGDRASQAEELVKEMAEAGALDLAVRTVGELEYLPARNAALAGVATAAAQHGRPGVALEIAELIEEDRFHSAALGAAARGFAAAGEGARAVEIAGRISRDRGVWIPEIARALAEAGDREWFGRLMVACSYHLDSAYAAAALAARLHPEQGLAVARRVVGS